MTGLDLLAASGARPLGARTARKIPEGGEPRGSSSAPGSSAAARRGKFLAETEDKGDSFCFSSSRQLSGRGRSGRRGFPRRAGAGPAPSGAFFSPTRRTGYRGSRSAARAPPRSSHSLLAPKEGRTRSLRIESVRSSPFCKVSFYRPRSGSCFFRSLLSLGLGVEGSSSLPSGRGAMLASASLLADPWPQTSLAREVSSSSSSTSSSTTTAASELHAFEARFSEMRVQTLNNGSHELKWCVFTKEFRGSIAKLVADTKARMADTCPTARVVALFVRSEFRGRNLGETLVRLAQRWLHENGFEVLRLDAEEKMDRFGHLVGFYKRLGFTIIEDEQITFEHNEDEVFRKVPMRCELRAALGIGSPERPSGPTTETLVAEPAQALSIAFVNKLRREAIDLIAAASKRMTISQALDEVARAHPVCESRALKAGSWIRSRGHPDWLELAGYLRFLGRVQDVHRDWHAPYELTVLSTEVREDHDADSSKGSAHSATEEEEDDETMQRDAAQQKSGALPTWCVDALPRRTLEVESYPSRVGVEDVTLSWSPDEYAFLALTVQPVDAAELSDLALAFRRMGSTAPPEMARVIRYQAYDEWFPESNEAFNPVVASLEAYGDDDIRVLSSVYRKLLKQADAAEWASIPGGATEEQARARRSFLIAKYLANVCVM